MWGGVQVITVLVSDIRILDLTSQGGGGGAVWYELYGFYIFFLVKDLNL